MGRQFVRGTTRRAVCVPMCSKQALACNLQLYRHWSWSSVTGYCAGVHAEVREIALHGQLDQRNGRIQSILQVADCVQIGS